MGGRRFDRLLIVGRERPVEEAVTGAGVEPNLDLALPAAAAATVSISDFGMCSSSQAVVELERHRHVADLVEMPGDAERIEPDGRVDAGP